MMIQYCVDQIKVCTEKESSQNEKKLTLGHFPEKIKHCKECRVCTIKFNDWFVNKKKGNRRADETKPKKKKSKYQCEACSAEEGKPVPLCVTCFGEYHR